ncbi:multidrug resistance-associated protein 1-like [Lineus longissimus]|uniref:multidrug resistance-associated protein 1-like n=1 Tax=Lineus longissimus TaxID=88925 RepID=UPI002B4E1602
MASNGGVTYWDAVCGNSSREWAFWDDSLTINTTNPDLTTCFQSTVLVWVPCLFLWLCSPFYIVYLAGKPTIHGTAGHSKLNIVKIVFSSLLTFTCAADLCLNIYDHFSGYTTTPVVQFATPAILLVTMILATVYISVEYMKGQHTSGVLFIFWFAFLLVGIIRVRSTIIQEALKGPVTDLGHFILFYIVFAFVLISFVLTLFADLEALEDTTGPDEMRLTFIREGSFPELDLEPPSIKHEECPELKATFLSQILFLWMTGMIYKGKKKVLQFADLWKLRRQDRADVINDRFEQAWKPNTKGERHTWRERQSSVSFVNQPGEDGDQPPVRIIDEVTINKPKEPSMLLAYIKVVGRVYFITGLYKLCYDAVQFLQPTLLSLLITYVSGNNPYQWQGYALGICLFLISVLRSIFFQLFWEGCFATGMRMRTMITSAVYRKSLKLSSSAKRASTAGEIVNLMSVDAQKLQDAPIYLHFSWSAPFVIAVSMGLLWQQLGAACLAGLIVLALIIPVSAMIAKKSQGLQEKQMSYKDERMKMMTEVLGGIKVLKLYAWEGSFMEKVMWTRNLEINKLRTSSYLDAITFANTYLAPYLVSLASFAVYVLTREDRILDANKAFVSLSLFAIITQPMNLIPPMISYWVQSLVSTKRIKLFLAAEELQPDAVDHNPADNEMVTIKDASFTWDVDERPTLKNLNMNVKPGTLVAVVGHVGAGKSSLISAILGDMYKTQGSIDVTGKIAYVPQQAWIQNLTLKNNILFGKEYDEGKYQRTIEACALTSDLKILPGGDEAEIGDKGVNMSGGQKQRISIARAVYQDLDLYLLDDPLSAVDAHVGKHIFSEVVGREGLLKDKTRIFVTHGVTYLPYTDYIVVLNKEGGISEAGPYQELISHKGAFAEYIQTYLLEGVDERVEEDDEVLNFHETLARAVSQLDDDDEKAEMFLASVEEKIKTRSMSRRKSMTRSITAEESIKIVTEQAVKKQTLMTEEVAETGSVSWAVYLNYGRAAGLVLAVTCILLYFGLIASATLTYLWLGYWSNDQPKNGTNYIEKDFSNYRLGVYGGVGTIQILTLLGLAFAMAETTIRATKDLHSRMLTSIMHSPMEFFDTTPLGRIFNRMSKDVDILDTNIPMTLRLWVGTSAFVVTTLIMITISTPWFLVALVPLLGIYYLVQSFYINTSRQLKRIESITRSPIFSLFGETVTGASSIRAYRQQDRFVKRIDELSDNNNMAYYPNIISTRWLGFWLDCIGNLMVLFASTFAVASRDSFGTSPGIIGLAITFSLRVTASLTLMVRMTCDMESYIVSAERIQEYTTLKSEADWTKDDQKPPIEWPDSGKVQFIDYATRYREGLELVVKNIQCLIKPGEKVGVVGRTGAGKSSLTLALFRIIEPTAGTITVDDWNITDLGLHDLRSKLTIIPQDPVLFSGTLRMNLDPQDLYTDVEIWSSLELSNLKDFVAGQERRLGFICTEGGENLSVGQRQLICLARALLRKTKILVLDEATAAVDLETDEMIQRTIREEFKNSTIITIAHRLNTIMDYDRILVLDKGEIKEFDTPSALLHNSKSIFHGMARDAGLI